ncbi:FAD-dependent monooxygenase [Immundisolibacter sp.]|uniref:FAD-dependent monooxygenase n=1 Tax=Immundisolibacter sp. TaxID=1934948 RepID=UPI0035682B96
MTADCDVLIAGAGPAGAALACALAHLPLRVLLVDAAPLPDPKAADRRALALGLGSQRILQGLDVWSTLAEQATPIRRVEVTEKGWPGVTRLAASELGQPALGWVLGDIALQRALLARLEDSSVRRAAVAVTALADGGEALAVTACKADGVAYQVTTRLLVAADGSDSAVCRLAGLRRHQRELPHSVLLGRLHTDRAHSGVAHERFAAEGPMALLPGAHPLDYTVVWTLPHERAQDLITLPAAHLIPLLQSAFGWRAGRFVALTESRCVRLREAWLTGTTANRLVAIGSAANTLHPIAAQGFNLGLRDVAELATGLAAAAAVGADPGSADLVRAYQQGRQADWRGVRQATRWLPCLFENPAPPLAAVRGLGLASLDVLAPLKRRLMVRAMGVTAPQSRLQRGYTS